jgi:P27 family predicted phage terminase small subunit
MPRAVAPEYVAPIKNAQNQGCLTKNPAMTTAKSPPKGLSTAAKAWWKRLASEYGIDDDAGLLLLQTGLEAFDRMRGAQEAIQRDGMTVLDRFGQRKAHPLLPAERDARAQMLAALRALNLDVEPLHDRPGRPAGK